MAEEAASGRRTKINRDSAFVRIFADKGLTFHLGRDIELAFLIEGPHEVTEVEFDDENTPDHYQVDFSALEIGRVRMSPGGAVVLALSILNDLAPTGKMKMEALREAFDQIIEKGVAASNQDQSEQDANGNET